MSGTSALYSRLLFLFALVCAAVMPFIVCSDAARARPMTTQVNNGVRHSVLRRPYTPHSQHHPLFTGLPSRQTGANRETEARGNYRKTSSIIHRYLKPLRLTKGSLRSYNSPNNRRSRAGTTSAPSGTSPASGYHPLSYNSYPVIIKKSSYKEAARPFHQSSGPSDAQKSYIKERVPRNDSPSLFLSQTGRYRSTSLPTSRGLYSGYKEPNELTSAGAWSTSSGIQSSTFFDLASQTVPHAPSISSRSDASVIKSIPSREKLTPPVTDFFLGLHTESGSETPRPKKIRSYLFKDSQTAFVERGEGPGALPTTSHKRRALDVISRFPSNGKRLQQSQRKDPTEEVQHLSDDANPLYRSANVTHYGAQADGLTKYEPAAQISAPGKDAILESFVSIPRADVLGNSADGSSKSVVSSFSNATTRGSTHAPTPGQAIKNIYGFRRFNYPKWKAMKRPPILSSSGSNERTNSRGYSFKITNVNHPLSPKYSFGQRKASAPVAKPEGATTDHSSPSPGTHQDLTSAFKEARPGSASDAGVDGNPDHRRFRTERRIDGLKAFGSQSLEGDTTLVSEPEESARVQQGFKLPSSQIWEPKISHMNRTEPSSEDQTPLLRNSSAYLRSAVKLNIESKLKSEPQTPDQTNPFAKVAHLLHSSTSNTMRGKRVRGGAKKLNESTLFRNTRNDPIFRRPARRRAINYADIVASVSFRGVAATRQTPTTPADKDDFDATQQREGAGYGTLNSEEAVRSGDDTGTGPDADNDMKTSDLVLDNESSGSGDFDASEVLSTATTKSQGLGKGVPELEYLRMSPGTVSFKSISLSHTET